MLQGELSAVLLTCIMLPFVITILVLPIFELPFYTGLIVLLLKALGNICLSQLMIFWYTYQIR